MRHHTTSTEARSGAVALLPIGSFESHGSHLPFATDSLIATHLAARLAEEYPALLLPTVGVTTSSEHAHFRGTVSAGITEVIAYVRSIIIDLARQDFSIGIVNAHGGNQWLAPMVMALNAEGHRCCLFWDRDAIQCAFADADLSLTPDSDAHGGEMETSIALTCGFTTGEPPARHVADDRPLFDSVGFSPFAPNSYVGDPRAATASKGEKLLDSLVGSFRPFYEFLTQQ